MLQSIDKKNKVIIYIIFFLLISTVTNKNILHDKNYNTKKIDVNVSGLSNDHNLEITNRINEMSLNNVFFIDIEPILNLLLSYNLIEQYSIKKIYPNSINIFILPTKFIAKIKNKNGVFMIGNNGKLIKTQKIDKDLPLLYGKFDSKYFLEFYNFIIQSEFKYNEIESILYFPSRRWDLKLKDETLIKLPSNNLTKSLKLAYLIKKKKNKSIKIIDLRIKNRIVIK
jgi:cell division protein FtsQ